MVMGRGPGDRSDGAGSIKPPINRPLRCTALNQNPLPQHLTDGLDEVRPGEPIGSIRGQVIGLLNAIQYLKRAWRVFILSYFACLSAWENRCNVHALGGRVSLVLLSSISDPPS